MAKNITIMVPGKHPQTGELDAQHPQCITIQNDDLICEADTQGSHGYICISPATHMEAQYGCRV